MLIFIIYIHLIYFIYEINKQQLLLDFQRVWHLSVAFQSQNEIFKCKM